MLSVGDYSSGHSSSSEGGSRQGAEAGAISERNFAQFCSWLKEKRHSQLSQPEEFHKSQLAREVLLVHVETWRQVKEQELREQRARHQEEQQKAQVRKTRSCLLHRSKKYT